MEYELEAISSDTDTGRLHASYQQLQVCSWTELCVWTMSLNDNEFSCVCGVWTWVMMNQVVFVEYELEW